jgi:dihydrolipoamide dehydrogenase
VGTGAGELLAEATNVLRRGGLVDELTETVHSHPTLGEVVAEAAAAALAGQGPRADEAP